MHMNLKEKCLANKKYHTFDMQKNLAILILTTKKFKKNQNQNQKSKVYAATDR